MNYYYFSASLPTLSMEEEPPLSQSEFAELCKHHLSDSDISTIEELFNEPNGQSSSEFVREWHSAETQLRNAIVRKRASNQGLDPDPFIKSHSGYSTYVEKAVEAAYGKNTPLEREKTLDDFRWTHIDELSGFDSFSNRAIFAYALQLQLALRWSSMKEDAGTEKVNAIVTQGSTPGEHTTDDGGSE